MKRIKLFYWIFIGFVIISCSNSNEAEENNQENSFPINSDSEYLESVVTDNRNHPSLGIVVEEFIIYENNRPIYRLIDLDYTIENQDDYNLVENYGKADEIHKYIYGANGKVIETRVYKNYLHSPKLKLEGNQIFNGNTNVTENNSIYEVFYHEYDNDLIKKIINDNSVVEYIFDNDLNIISKKNTISSIGTSEIIYTNIDNKIEKLYTDYNGDVTEGVYGTHNQYLNPYHKLFIDFGIFSFSSALEIPPFSNEWEHKYFVEEVYTPYIYGNIIDENEVLKTNALNYPIETLYYNTYLITNRYEKIIYVYK